MNSQNFSNSNFNMDNKYEFPRDSLNPSSSGNNTINVENNNKQNTLTITNSVNNDNFNFLQKQNKNLQNQISILTKRIKEYEKDYIMNNDQKLIQIKEFYEKEKELNNIIQEKNQLINKLNKENENLKFSFNQTEKDLNMLKQDVKNVLELKKKSEAEKELEKNISENQSEDLIDMMKKYSDEIFYLKEQNRKLINNLNMMTISNDDKKINLSNQEEMKLRMERTKFENFLDVFVKEINEELFVISQWIETYLGREYDKGFEIPSLINNIDDKVYNKKINQINFNLIKESLEKSTIQLNSVISNKENEIIKLNNIIKGKENEYKEIKKELIRTKDKHKKLTNENDILKMEKENEVKMVLNHKTLLEDLRKNEEKCRDNNFSYLKEIYKTIQEELNLILSDENFKIYHEKIFNLKESHDIYNNNVNDNYFEDKLNNLLIKFIDFVEELRYDYIQIKEDNMKILSSRPHINKDLLITNDKDDIINTYKRKISELTNDNNFLSEQMRIMSRNNDLNLLKEDFSRYSNVLEENKELKFNNDNLMDKIKIMNNNYLNLAKQNDQLKEAIKGIKISENNDINFKNKLNELTMDYKRLLKENDCLKIYINSQNLGN